MMPKQDEAIQRLLLSAMDRMRIWERWALLFGSIQVKMAALHGAGKAAEKTRRLAADTLLHLLILAVVVIILGFVGGLPMLQAGGILLLLYPWYVYKKLDGQVRTRQRIIILELPELLNKLILLINAGETIHQAIHRCVTPTSTVTPIGGSDRSSNPLQAEWAKLSRELKDNKPFVYAMEDFSRSCGVLEVSMFATAVIMNFKRGGSDFVAALLELSHTLWERRKAVAKTVGEEASSKLVFPMVLLFCTVMIIVAAPAVLMMN